jgi:hypothetical protein
MDNDPLVRSYGLLYIYAFTLITPRNKSQLYSSVQGTNSNNNNNNNNNKPSWEIKLRVPQITTTE